MSIVGQFLAQGFIVVRNAFSTATAEKCVEVVRTSLKLQGIDFNNHETWTKPVVRINCPDAPAFAEAGTSQKLHEIYDLLLGSGRWIPRQGVGGTLPIRFPSASDPGDAGWHIDGSYDVNGSWHVNVHSKGRGLLALFLFTDVHEADAPTEILMGSHLDIPLLLAKYGVEGTPFGPIAKQLPASTFLRPTAKATGKAGDVFVCHPFLVHRATWPHTGIAPRIIAQPEVRIREPFRLVADGACPVEQAILNGLSQLTALPALPDALRADHP